MNALIPTSFKHSLDKLRSDIDRTISGWADRWRGRNEPQHNGEEWPMPSVMLNGGGPPVDLVDKDDRLVATAELPGMDPDQFHVELSGNRLVIRGEKQASREENRDGYFYSECRYGSFYRAVPLPCEVREKDIKAVYRHGVLRVELPKTESARAKRVDVKVA